ncbi:MAG: hypothetical protein KKA60_05075 [Proteobacteria bacterium]|nr:hypothetical protein [Pseudomonadota bacterium]
MSPRNWGLEDHERTLKNLFTFLALSLLVLFSAKLAVGYIRSLPLLLPDEGDILIPAFFHLEKGIGYPFQKYPPFPFMLYETMLWVFSWFLPLKTSNLFLAGRLINLGLCSANILLLFVAARDWMEDRWALLAAFFFAFCPLTLLSYAFVKTESLLVAEILVALWAGFRVMKNPESAIYNGVCALAAATAAATNFNPMPAVIWLAFASMGLSQSGMRLRRIPWGLAVGPGTRWFAPLCFLFLFFLFLPAWEALKDFSLEEFRQDCHALSAPTLFRATESFLAFPYGRIAFPFTFLLPFALGPLHYLLTLAALGLRAVPPKWAASWMIACAVYLALHIAVIVPLGFSFLIPFVPVASVAPVFLLKRTRKILGRGVFVLVLLLMGLSLYQSPALIGMVGNLQMNLKKIPEDCKRLVSHCDTANQGWDPNAPSEDILTDLPTHLFYSDSYGSSFCKAGNDKECRFFRNLTGPDSPYTVQWVSRTQYPWKWLAVRINPEASFNFYLLERKE